VRAHRSEAGSVIGEGKPLRARAPDSAAPGQRAAATVQRKRPRVQISGGVEGRGVPTTKRGRRRNDTNDASHESAPRPRLSPVPVRITTSPPIPGPEPSNAAGRARGMSSTLAPASHREDPKTNTLPPSRERPRRLPLPPGREIRPSFPPYTAPAAPASRPPMPLADKQGTSGAGGSCARSRSPKEKAATRLRRSPRTSSRRSSADNRQPSPRIAVSSGLIAARRLQRNAGAKSPLLICAAAKRSTGERGPMSRTSSSSRRSTPRSPRSIRMPEAAPPR